MTEAEWTSGESVANQGFRTLREYAMELGSERKLRLFACGCVRRFWHLLPEGPARTAVVVTERWADQEASEQERRTAHTQANQAFHAICAEVPHSLEEAEAMRLAMWAADVNLATACRQASSPARPLGDATAFEPQLRLLRDIFGNPFRPVALAPEWRTDTVILLARQMYESRDFNAMPILADALQDAGCDSEDVLNHCRGEGPHVRGCWVVDLVLGKA